MWRRGLLLLTAFTLSVAAHATDVQTDYDTEKDFSQLHNYGWQIQSDSIDESFALLSADQIKDLLAYNLDQQLTPASEKLSADLLVRFYIKTIKKLVDDRPQIGIGMGGFNNNVGGGVSFSIPLGGNDLDQRAQIVVDFLDAKTQKLIWRGSLATNVSSKSTTANQKQLQKAFSEILKKFPPRE